MTMGRKKIISTPPAPIENSPLEVSELERNKIISACKRAELSIDNYVAAIKDALSAEKLTIDKFGEEHIEIDHDKRLKAALMGLELEGYIKNKTVNNETNKYTQVNYSWQPVKIINHGAEIELPRGEGHNVN